MTAAAQGLPSWPIQVEDLSGEAPTLFRFKASDSELGALATSLGAPSVKSFEAEFEIVRRPRGRVHVVGQVRANVTRICVVTLEPFDGAMAEPIEIDFAPEEQAATEAARVSHQPKPGESLADLPDPPDPIIEGRIDLGAVAVEFLTLAMDPYPRKPSAQFEPPAVEKSPADSPFAALERLKRQE